MINWTIDHDRRLVTATTADVITVAAITQYLAEVAAAGGMPYGKCLDGRFSTLDLSPADLRSLAAAVEDYAIQGPLGPIAIVVDAEMSAYAAQIFQKRTAERNRPIAVFWKIDDAMGWLSERL